MRRIGEWSMAASLVLAAGVAALGAGCAQDVGDIDRTQPDKVKKAMFQDDDEWYYRQTIIDTDTQGSVIFEAYESPLKRIRWTINEDTLFAYSSVPLIDGIEDRHSSEEDRRLGAVIGFNIARHFDVQRQYNAQTGEQTNVIVEDSTDRPWYERDYMRVSWGVNEVNGDGLASGMFAGAAMSYHVRHEPEVDVHVDPDRTRITDDLIDVVTEYSFEPDIYACALNVGMLETINFCEGGRIKVRHSFVRIKDDADTPWDDTNDYEPFMMTDNHKITKDGSESSGTLYATTVYDRDTGYYFDAECTPYAKDYVADLYGTSVDDCQPATFDMFARFGYFRTERMRWNEEYPNQDDDRLHYANRWNIWQTAYGDDGDLLALEDRTPKPIVYHLNAEYPKDMIAAAKEVERQWDEAFLDSVRIAKGYDSIDKVRTELEDEYGDARMFQIRENSCMPGPLAQWQENFGGARDGDRKSVQAIFDDRVGSAGSNLEESLWAMPTEERVQLCAELEWATESRKNDEARFSWERVGDLRYSFFNWVDEFNGYWSGYGPSAADPLTGEIISGNANFAGTPLRSYATRGTDIVQYINGELSDEDIRTGEHVRQYLADQRANVRQQSLVPELPAEAQRELVRRGGLQPSAVSPTNFTEPPSFEEQDRFIKRWGKDRIMQEADRLSKTVTQAKKSDTRLIEFYEQPEVKQIMMRDADFSTAVRALAHDYFGANPDEDQIHQAYLDMATPKDVLRRSDRFSRMLAENNIFASENLERGLTSLVTFDGAAQAFKGLDRGEIRRYLMENAFIGTQLHEVGHTVGLRHNFGASMDALNYHDGFWMVRRDVANGTLVDNDAPGAEDTDGVTITASGTVHISDPDLAQHYSGKPEAKYVSTTEMRLGSIMDYTGDMTGRFAGLGKYDKAAITFAYGEHVQQWADDVELPNLLWYEEWVSDYADLPTVYGNRPRSQDPQVYADGVEVMLDRREWVPIKDAIASQREGLKTNAQNFENGVFDRNTLPYIDRTVPFEFCSDEFSDSSLGCDVYDWGGNHTEIVNHAFNQYRFFQPFWRYMGNTNDRLQENYSNYIGRVQRTFATASRPFRYYSIYQWLDLGSYTDDLQRASIDAINFFAEVMATPEPDRYCLWNDSESPSGLTEGSAPIEAWYYNLDGTFVPNNWHIDETACSTYIDIGRGDGQFYGYDFTDEYDYRIRRAGTYVDKTLVTEMLFDISANYAYSSFFTDARATNVSFWTMFENELHGFLRGMILGDHGSFAGRWDTQNQRYVPPKVVDPETFGRAPYEPEQDGRRIFTTVSFNQKFSTLVGGMLMNSTFEDRATNFSNYVKVAVTNDELQPFPEGEDGEDFDVAKLVHPISGQIYHAPQTADGKSISYDLVQQANELKQQWLDAQDDLEQANVDLENGDIDEDIYQSFWEDERGYRQAFEDVVARLEMIRYIFEAGRVMR